MYICSGEWSGEQPDHETPQPSRGGSSAQILSISNSDHIIEKKKDTDSVKLSRVLKVAFRNFLLLMLM